MNRTTYVNLLPIEIQKEIEKELTKHFVEKHKDLTAIEILEYVQNGMNSRLCDLSDTIDTDKYVQELEGNEIE